MANWLVLLEASDVGSIQIYLSNILVLPVQLSKSTLLQHIIPSIVESCDRSHMCNYTYI